MNILVIRHFEDRFSRCGRKKQISKLFVRHAVRQRILKLSLLCQPKRLNDGSSRTTTCFGNLGSVEPEAIEPQNLTIIGHDDDLLCCIHAFACNNILPRNHSWCSTVSAALFKLGGISVQLARLRCSISCGIFNDLPFPSIDIFILFFFSKFIYKLLVNCEPWSEFTISGDPYLLITSFKAYAANSLQSVFENLCSTIILECQIIADKYIKPLLILQYVMSIDHI